MHVASSLFLDTVFKVLFDNMKRKQISDEYVSAFSMQLTGVAGLWPRHLVGLEQLVGKANATPTRVSLLFLIVFHHYIS